MATSSGLPYDELVYHLDLCILSYALYTHTLVFPFDPYYEHMAMKVTSRRTNVMSRVRAWVRGQAAYRGPGSTRGWASNDNLDPIICRYDRVRPWWPAVCRPEKGSWLLYDVPRQITDKISTVHVCDYTGHTDPNGLNGQTQVTQIAATQTAGQDILYCFEGGTGGRPAGGDDCAASWSLMGFALDRQKTGGRYDVHIAFRGSRSGSGARAVVQASMGMTPSGNPDWVTDMDFAMMVDDPVFGDHGSVSRGFSHTVKTCMPTIQECLGRIHLAHGHEPDSIWVTGHSLGGALATLFTAAMSVGSVYGRYGQRLVNPVLRTWPWDAMKLISVSAPKSAEKSYERNFNSKVYCRRVVLSKDPVTKEPPRLLSGRHAVWMPEFRHVGSEVYVTAEDTVKHAVGGRVPVLGGVILTMDHEPKAIRERLIRKLRQWGDVGPPVPPRPLPLPAFVPPAPAPAPGLVTVRAPASLPPATPAYEHNPWCLYTTFALMCGHPNMTDEVIHSLFHGLEAEARAYLSAVREVMGLSNSYSNFVIRQSEADRRQTAADNAIRRIGATAYPIPPAKPGGTAQTPAAFMQAQLATTVRYARDVSPEIGAYFGQILLITELGANANLHRAMFTGSADLGACEAL